MALNPLNFPKKEKKKVQATVPARWSSIDPGTPAPPPPPRHAPPRRMSKKEELEEQARAAKDLVRFDVQGVGALKAGIYKVPHRPDQPLRIYLHAAGLVMTGIKYAMYDTGNYEKGRLRTSYIPPAGAIILIGPRNYSPILRKFQVKKVDAEKVLAAMAPKEISMRYGPKKEAEPEKTKNSDGVEQW